MKNKHQIKKGLA